ncbi:MAG: IS1634 family transposase [Candidatus Acidiferrales bacterium]
MSRKDFSRATPREPGRFAQVGNVELHSYDVGALPLINHILDKMGLEQFLSERLPPDDPRAELPTAQGLMVMVRNVLLSRQPIYGVGEWAARFAPDLFNLWDKEVALLGDDRLGRNMVRAHVGVTPQLVIDFTHQVSATFQLRADEFHNDSTTVSFYGAYASAAEEGERGGRPTPAITFGHSKARRPDLKQLLYTLTINEDGGVPVFFTTSSGNVTDDTTHVETWERVCQLTGKRDFLYVADCKLASKENLAHLAARGGRFVTVLPRSRKEDESFRARLREGAAVAWQTVYDVTDEKGEVLDRLSVCGEESVTSDGYRLWWYHSTRKAALDASMRARRLQRVLAELDELRSRLAGPRTRWRERVKVEEAVGRILSEQELAGIVVVRIDEREEADYRQAKPGRPNKETQYVKETRLRFELGWELDQSALMQAEEEDGLFPLISNDRTLSAEQVLRAYKRQPLVEKRFSQFKTDFAVAPVYLQDVARISGLLAVYFFALMAQTLLERELRRAMSKRGVKTLSLYPEGRPCARPTAHRMIELFEPVQRHVLQMGEAEPQVMVTELTRVQRQVLELLGLSPESYGH